MAYWLPRLCSVLVLQHETRNKNHIRVFVSPSLSIYIYTCICMHVDRIYLSLEFRLETRLNVGINRAGLNEHFSSLSRNTPPVQTFIDRAREGSEARKLGNLVPKEIYLTDKVGERRFRGATRYVKRRGVRGTGKCNFAKCFHWYKKALLRLYRDKGDGEAEGRRIVEPADVERRR